MIVFVICSVDDKQQAMEEIKAVAFLSRASAFTTTMTSGDGRGSTETVNDESTSSAEKKSST
jgi:hypothetical protein